MGSNAPDTSGFIDVSGLNVDSAPIDLLTQGLATPPATGGTAAAGGQASGGLGTISGVIDLVTQFAQFIAQAVVGMEHDPVQHFVTQAAGWAGNLDILSYLHPDQVYKQVIQDGPGSMIRDMLELGLNVDTSKWDADANSGLDTADRIVGFAFLLQLAIAAVDTFGEGLLANRFGKVAVEAIRTIPEELGLSLALGIVISDSFKAAIGTQLERAIYKSKRPNEPEWQIARLMLRQHILEEKDLVTILENAGFSQDWIDKITKLEEQPLPVGDIQAMYQQGVIDDTAIDPMLLQLGFSDANRERIKQLYVTKAETAAGAELRTVWRTFFRNGFVSEGEYRTKLDALNFPKRLIDGDVQAVLDEQQYGWRVQSVAVVKSEYLHSPGSQSTAISKLQGLGMNHADATDLVNSWTAPPITRKHGLSQAQVMKYYLAGLLDERTAREDLMSLGVTPDAIDFLITNAPSTVGAHVVRLTPALVIQAYLLGAIQQTGLKAALEKAGTKGDVTDYYYQQALYKYAHHHESGSGQTPLSEGHILSLFKLGIWDEPTTLTGLEALGYSAANATLLLEIENKGPIKPPQPPAFGSVSAAMYYLAGLGFTFQGPPDPTYEAALSMVESAGYLPLPPPGFTAPTLTGIEQMPPTPPTLPGL